MRKFLIALGLLAVIVAAMLLYGLAKAQRDPVVKQVRVPLADWPTGAKPVQALLLSDIHYGNLAMGNSRLARIIDQANALKPDLVLLAGDYVAGHDAATASEAAPALATQLARLKAPLGVVAVLGNHDHWTDAAIVTRALAAAHVQIVSNGAIQRGPLVIGGADDQFSGHDNLPAMLDAMDALHGARIVLAHTPDVARALRSRHFADRTPATGHYVVLAGHTHCGQVVMPGLGPIKTVIDAREVYLCGVSQRGPDSVIVTGGVGTSVVPIRFGAPPDMWIVTFGPVTR